MEKNLFESISEDSLVHVSGGNGDPAPAPTCGISLGGLLGGALGLLGGVIELKKSLLGSLFSFKKC